VEGEEEEEEDGGGVVGGVARRRPIVDIRYDYLHRPIQKAETGDDGPWGEVANPVHAVTGLWYDNKHSDDTTPDGGGGGEKDANTSKNSSNNSNGSSKENGSGADWYDLMHQLIRHGYETGLTTNAVDQHPLLLVERSYNPPPIRQETLECLFEELQVPATFLAKDAVLSAYASGRVTGTVVDMGYNGTTVTPVFDGYVETKGIQYCPVGVRQQDMLLLEYMDLLYAQKMSKKAKTAANTQGVMPLYQVRRATERGDGTFARRSVDFHRVARLALAQECRECGALAEVDTAAAAGVAYHAPQKSFSLPDGTTILDIPSAYRFASAEFLIGDPSTVVLTADSANGEGEARPSSSSSTSLSSKTSSATLSQRRQDLTEQRRRDLAKILAKVTAAVEAAEKEKEAADDNAASSSTNMLTGSGGGDGDEFTEATAVGISKRRTQRGKTPPSSSSKATINNSTQRPSFSNSRLQKACLGYLQVHLDQHITSSSIANMICDAAYKCDRDQQGALLGNVILGGGGSCMGPTEAAVPDKIREQVEGLIHAHTPVCLSCSIIHLVLDFFICLFATFCLLTIFSYPLCSRCFRDGVSNCMPRAVLRSDLYFPGLAGPSWPVWGPFMTCGSPRVNTKNGVQPSSIENAHSSISKYYFAHGALSIQPNHVRILRLCTT
jgi:Actin